MKAADIRMKTEKELNDELFKLKRECLNLRFQKAAGDNVKSNRKAMAKKEIARILTVLNEKKNNKKGGSNA